MTVNEAADILMQSFAFCVNTKQTSAGQSDKHAQQVQSCSVLLILLSCKVCSAIKFFERSASASAFRSTYHVSNVRPIENVLPFSSRLQAHVACLQLIHLCLREMTRGTNNDSLQNEIEGNLKYCSLHTRHYCHRSRPHPSNCKPQQMLVTTHHLTCQHALAELPATWIVGSPPSNGGFVE